MKTPRLLRPSHKLAILAALLATVASLHAITPSEWRFRQTLEITTAGLVRVDLPPATLDAARPALDDLRVLDAAGNEVPLLIERPMPQPETTSPAAKFENEIQPDATVLTMATGTKSPLVGVTLATPAAGFIKAMRVEGSHDRAHWQELAAGQMIFRLERGAEKLRVDFPEGAWEFLRLTLDDQRSKPVPFSSARTHTSRADAPHETVAVAIKSRHENDGVTRLALDPGASNLTISSLTFETPEPLFTRRISVAVPEISEDGIRERTIGEGMIFRVNLEGKSAARIEFALDQPIPARELIVFIRNDDSPPLAVRAVRAERRLSRVVFFAGAAGTFTLLSGNSQSRAPRYDVSALAAELKSATASNVTPSPLAENPGFKIPEALAALTIEGAAIDTRDWKFRKPVPLARAGAQQLELDLEVLSRAQSDYRDLRLVRGTRQLPFLMECTSISRAIPVNATISAVPKHPSVSRWTLKLPKPALPITRLVCASTSALFHREIRVWEEVTDERGEKYPRDLGRASWQRTPQQTMRENSVVLNQTPVTDTLFVETDNGDNSAIELRDFRCHYAATRLVFKAAPEAAAPLWIYYGNRQAAAPRYDLSLVAPELLRAEKSPVALGAEESLKSKGERAGEAISAHGSWMLWGTLAIVVVALLVVIARLLPREN